jgi:hypothetical protein
MITLPEIKDHNSPILMLNLLKFSDRRVYFEEYIPAFNKVTQQLGITGAKVRLVTDMLANIIADENEKWDAVAIVEYPSVDAFMAIATSDAYHDLAEPLRLAALQNWKLYMTRETGL